MIQEYFRARTKQEALSKISKGYLPIGGGTYISQHQDDIFGVVDLQDLGLGQIKQENDHMIFGATTTLQDIYNCPSVDKSLKDVIAQEVKPNMRNAVTIAGQICMGDGFSNLQAWLICADVRINLYPSHEALLVQPMIHCQDQSKGSFIESVSIMENVNIRWDVVSRTADDIPLVGVFYSDRNDGSARITLSGFNQHIQCLDIHDKSRISEKLSDYLINAHSQYNNKFVSFKYFLKNSQVLLERIISKEVS